MKQKREGGSDKSNGVRFADGSGLENVVQKHGFWSTTFTLFWVFLAVL